MRILTLATILLLIFTGATFTQPNLTITYPKPGAMVFASDSVFVLGKVEPAQAGLWIDSARVPVYPNGAFLVMLPLDSACVVFNFRVIFANDTLFKSLPVRVAPALISCRRDTLVYDSGFIFPRDNLVLRAGDLLQVAVKGTPGCRAQFYVPEVIAPVALDELPASRRYFWQDSPVGGAQPVKSRGVAGVYSGTYRIKPTDFCQNSPIKIRLIKNLQDTLEFFTPGTLSLDTLKTPLPAQIPLLLANTQKIAEIGTTYLLPERSKTGLTGQAGPKYRVALSAEDQVWLKIDSLNFLPPQTNLNYGTIFSVQVNQTAAYSTISVRLKEPVPVQVQQLNQPARFLVTFFGVKSNLQQINQLRNLSEIKSIKWNPTSGTRQELLIEMTHPQIWGYRSYFDKNQFTLEIKNQPDFAAPPFSSLKDRVITLDPGHNPDSGAVGPTGVLEKDVNLQVCLRLKKRLEKKGALVVLTREHEQGVALLTRPLLAAFVNADVLISLHFNSLPDGVNPYRNHGTSTYYYQPMSYPLALTLHEGLLEHLKLPDFGLFNRSLALTRPTEMLAVLLEPAFLIHPEEELKIQTPAFQDSIAAAVTQSLEKFFTAQQKEELPPPDKVGNFNRLQVPTENQSRVPRFEKNRKLE
jgi:N-acetylmuramoyl-L-alanine amidase